MTAAAADRPPVPRALYGVDEAAEALSISPSLVRQLVARGDLIPVRIPGVRRTLIRADELNRFVAGLEVIA